MSSAGVLVLFLIVVRALFCNIRTIVSTYGHVDLDLRILVKTQKIAFSTCVWSRKCCELIRNWQFKAK